MTYQVAERFKSLQGEGVYTGTPMAFIRFTGCSVGKRICQHCDTDFDTMMNWRGGGTYTAEELRDWAQGHEHICLTGGEPLDQDLEPLLNALGPQHMVHIETSGTVRWRTPSHQCRLWLCVSPKPGFHEGEVLKADEIKVIVPGLGDINPRVIEHWAGSEGDRTLKHWPTIEDALHWARLGKTVFLQPRNGKHDIDQGYLRLVQDILAAHPNLRLSVQMHKILRVQ